MLLRLSLIFVTLFVCISFSGCQPSEPTAEIVKTAPASGTLTYQGRPLAGHEVSFYPPNGGRPATGRSDDQGKFTLGTNGPDDGAVPGTHKVTVSSPAPTFASEPGKEDTSNIQLPKSTIPEKYSNAETSELTQTIPESGATDIKIELR